MKNIREVLEEFAYNLQSFSPGQIKEPVKITLPYELYRQFVQTIEETTYLTSYSLRGILKFNTSVGVSFMISCREIDEAHFHKTASLFLKQLNNDIY